MIPRGPARAPVAEDRPGRHGRGRPPDPDKHDATLVQARRFFTELGFDRSSMDVIAEAAGVAKATVYKHFGSKEALFETVLQSLLQELPTPDEMIAAPRGPLPARLHAIATGISRLAISPLLRGLQRMLALPMQSSRFAGRSFWRESLEPYQHAFADLLGEEAFAGRLAVPDPAAASSQFFSLVGSEPFIRVLMGEAAVADEVLAAHVDAAVAAFLRAYATTAGRSGDILVTR
jgi:AcrR family transcriptional regulator